jgi:disease resistance protein RPM1
MEFATMALRTLLPKLAQLLQEEYNLQKGARKDIEFLRSELEAMHAALRKVGEVPREQLEEVQMIWARDVRDLSHDMEDIIDTFTVDVVGLDAPSKRSIKKIFKKIKRVGKAMTRREMAQEIKDIRQRVKDVAERRDRSGMETCISFI